LDSLVDGRLFSQAKSLKGNYQRPVILLEGEGLYEKRNINDKAIYGALTSLACDFNLPIISTKDGNETASLLYSMVSRKKNKSRSSSVRKEKKSMSTYDTKKFILEGLPSISGKLADRLLEHFGSVRAVFMADKEELQQVKGIGPETADKIISIVE